MNYEAANSFLPKIERGDFGRMLTTDYVLDELTTLTMARVNHAAAVKLYESIMNSVSIEAVHVTEELRDKAFGVFRNYPERGYSFTDCVSFALMKSLHVNDVFAFDAHFAQFGFSLYPGN